MTSPDGSRSRWLWAAGTLLGMALALRFAALPKPLLDLFHYGWLPSLLLAGLTAWAMPKSASAPRLVASLFGALLLVGLPLLWVWCCHELRHGPYLFGRLLPSGDASAYLRYATALLDGEPMQKAIFDRPLFPGFLATLLAVTRFDLRWVLVLFTLANGLALWQAGRVVCRHAGVAAAAVFLLLLHFIYRIYAGLVMTEELGFALGMLGAAELLDGWLRRHQAAALRGLFWLSMAMMARPAAMFVLPAVAALLALANWSAQSWRERARAAVLAGLPIIAAMAINAGLRGMMFRDEPCQNVWYDTYAMTHDLPTWHSGAQAVGGDWQVAKAKSLQLMREQPICLIKMVSRTLGGTLGQAQFWRFNDLGSGAGLFACLAFAGLCSPGATATMRRWWWLNLAVWLGFIASVPFASLLVTGFRIYAAAAPVQMLLIAHAVWQVMHGLHGLLGRLANPLAWLAVIVTSLGLCIGLELATQSLGLWHGLGGGLALAGLLHFAQRGSQLSPQDNSAPLPSLSLSLQAQAAIAAWLIVLPPLVMAIGHSKAWPAGLAACLRSLDPVPAVIPAGMAVQFVSQPEPTRMPQLSLAAAPLATRRPPEAPRASLVLDAPGGYFIGLCKGNALCAFAGQPGEDFHPTSLQHLGTWEGAELYLDASLAGQVKILPVASQAP